VELTADCARCVGLCCVLLPFSRSADFAFDKAAGEPCRHLSSDHRCGIHAQLREEGMRGCVAYDCFGAGQAVTETGRVEVFHVVEQVHQVAWYLADAADRGADVAALVAQAEALAAAAVPTAEQAGELRSRVSPVLREVAEAARAPYDDPLAAAGTDLVGADLRGADLRGADLRGALLIEADLRGVDLTDGDLLGADLRGASLADADLSRALYLTRRQLGSVRTPPDAGGTPLRLRT
jgi:Pentapeptide repeats (8 copies)